MALSGPSSPQTEAFVSMTTLRWDPLLAIDSSQSALSAEGGSGDKERFNSICSEWLLAPHVHGIRRLHCEPHRSTKPRKVGERVRITLSCLSPRFSPLSDVMITLVLRCSLSPLFFSFLIFCHLKGFSLQEASPGRKKLHFLPTSLVR